MDSTPDRVRAERIGTVIRQVDRFFMIEANLEYYDDRQVYYLRPQDMKGAKVGDKVKIVYTHTLSRGLWHVAEVLR